MKVTTKTETTYYPNIGKSFTIRVEGDKANVSTGVFWDFTKNWSASDLRAAADTLLKVADIMEGGN